MKKTLLAILLTAVAVPLTFAAQAPASTDNTAKTTKTTKKHVKKSTAKKSTAAPAATSTTPKP